jgi:ElaB/YqjD/DUF883 family membrane-anchored ribosome-binding protein
MNSDAANGLANELRRLLAELEEALGQGLQSAEEHLDGPAAKLRAALHRAREHLRTAEKELAARGHQVNETVRAHPWESIAVAGIAGFVLGRLGRRP